MSIVYLGLGSNLGNREKNVRNAVAALLNEGHEILGESSLIETEPVGGPANQNKFINAVIKIQTKFSPHELLQSILIIEQSLGRLRTVKNGPRTIDIDILLYDNLTIDSEELTIPHPRMFEREFVMKPLLEIEPNMLKQIDIFVHENN